jgi:PEP-CTERM motif
VKCFSDRLSIFFMLALGSTMPALASGINYTCDPSGTGQVSATTCNYLNNTVAVMYDNTFSNANANIYVEYGSTSLSANEQYSNFVSYTSYLNALTAIASGGAVQLDALTALNSLDTAIYGGGEVEVTAALGSALGFSGMIGITTSGAPCSLSAASCYNGLITISNTQSLYYRIGNETSAEYDVYGAVEHETDEILGTASCITTTTGSLANGCGGNTPSAVDLFRYQSAGDPVLMSTTAGAYFSFNGGATNGADGAIYNTLANGNDYADFISDCPTIIYIQDGMGCAGHDAGINITNDGPGGTDGPEITILNTVGYNLTDPTVPEPGTLGTFAFGFTALVAFAYRRRRTVNLWRTDSLDRASQKSQ